jgi:hypothetical protein
MRYSSNGERIEIEGGIKTRIITSNETWISRLSISSKHQYGVREVITMFQVKQSLPLPLDGLVGIHHKLVNHRCALEERANKRRKYWASVDAPRSTDGRAHH